MLTVTEDKCTMFGGGLDSDMDNLSMGGQIPRRSKRNGGRKAESNINYHTGTVCDARDFQNDWFRAEILAIAPNKRKKYYVHFEGFSDRYNEWVAKKDLAPLGTKSKAKDASYSSASTAPSIDCMIHPDQKKKMLDWIASSPNCEIGGDLFGKWMPDGRPFIQYVLGPGPKAQGGAVSFYQDEKYLEVNGNALGEIGLEHIGEWHSHYTLNLPHPSGGDCRTVINAMRDYERDHFILIIGTLDVVGGGGGRFMGFGGNYRNRQLKANHYPFVFTNGENRYERAKFAAQSTDSEYANFQLKDYTVANEFKTSQSQWYITPEGKTRLAGVLKALGDDDYPFKVRRGVVSHNIELVLTSFHATVYFPEDFPETPALYVKANTELKDSKPILFRGQFDAKDFANTVVSLALRDNITDAPELAFGDDDDDEDDYGNNDEHVADENAGPSADSLSSRIAQSVTNASAELDI